MDVFDMEQLTSGLDGSAPAFSRFFRAGALSLAVAYWPVGAEDDQDPHSEDEVYYIASGRGRLRVDEDDSPVGPGTVAYVAAGAKHHFHSIEEDLRVLVLFSSGAVHAAHS